MTGALWDSGIAQCLWGSSVSRVFLSESVNPGFKAWSCQIFCHAGSDGLTECDQPGKNPSIYSAVAGN